MVMSGVIMINTFRQHTLAFAAILGEGRRHSAQKLVLTRHRATIALGDGGILWRACSREAACGKLGALSSGHLQAANDDDFATATPPLTYSPVHPPVVLKTERACTCFCR